MRRLYHPLAPVACAALLLAACAHVGQRTVVQQPVPAILPESQVRQLGTATGVPDSVWETAILSFRLAGARLGLERWIIVVSWDSLGPDVAARATVRSEYRMAFVTLDHRHLAVEREQICRIVVHELFHVRLAPMSQALRELARAQGGDVMLGQAAAIEEEVVTDLERASYREICRGVS